MRKGKPCLIILSACFIFIFTGCHPQKSTYTKEKVVDSIISLCQREYNVDPQAWLVGDTLWVYMPLAHLITKDIQWDKTMLDKVNKVMMGASRVILSMKPRPQFMVVVASDVSEVGIDYITTFYITDIVKFQLQAISRDDFFRRHVTKIEQNPKSLGDLKGEHLEKKEIAIEDFVIAQIVQRIHSKFAEDPSLKDYYEVEDIRALLDSDAIRVSTQIKEKSVLDAPNIDIQKEIAKIVLYVTKLYNMENFLLVEIENAATGEKNLFSRYSLENLIK